MGSAQSQGKENPKLTRKLALNLDLVNSRLVIPLPARIQNNLVNADYFDSILNLTLPQSEEEKKCRFWKKIVRLACAMLLMVPL